MLISFKLKIISENTFHITKGEIYIERNKKNTKTIQHKSQQKGKKRKAEQEKEKNKLLPLPGTKISPVDLDGELFLGCSSSSTTDICSSFEKETNNDKIFNKEISYKWNQRKTSEK